MLFDTHCHLEVHPLTDLAPVQRDAEAHGIGRVLTMGLDPSRWPSVLELPKRWPAVDVALGVHPERLADRDPSAIDEDLEALLDHARSRRIAAVGECGLDEKTASAPSAALPMQLRLLDRHVEIARSAELPLVLHVLGTHGDALSALSRHPRLPRGGVVHAWSGSPELAVRWVGLGFSIGIGPSITFPNARRAAESARAVPLGSLVLETNAPFAYPAGPKGGARHGRSSDLVVVADRLAEILGLSRDELAAATTANAEQLFGTRLKA